MSVKQYKSIDATFEGKSFSHSKGEYDKESSGVGIEARFHDDGKVELITDFCDSPCILDDPEVMAKFCHAFVMEWSARKISAAVRKNRKAEEFKEQMSAP